MAKYKITTKIDSIVDASDAGIAIHFVRQMLLRKLKDLPEFSVERSIIKKIKKQRIMAGKR
jgi:hypothetical protein